MAGPHVTAPRSETISAAQVVTLGTIARMEGPAKVSSRTSETKRTVASAAARALAARGLVSLDDAGTVALTEQGSAFLGVRHVDVTPLHEMPAYRAGVAQAIADRRKALDELTLLVEALKDDPTHAGHAQREFARHQVARFHQIDQQEGQTS
ncbi:MAG: hypothetical protein ACEQSX_00405 [Baekduiaceae bacterium]